MGDRPLSHAVVQRLQEGFHLIEEGGSARNDTGPQSCSKNSTKALSPLSTEEVSSAPQVQVPTATQGTASSHASLHNLQTNFQVCLEIN